MAPDLDPFCLLNRPQGEEDWWGSRRPGASEICSNPDTAPGGRGLVAPSWDSGCPHPRRRARADPTPASAEALPNETPGVQKATHKTQPM